MLILACRHVTQSKYINYYYYYINIQKLNRNRDQQCVVKDQAMVAEVLADHFASIAEGIGGCDAELMSVEDFKNHGSVRCIRDSGNTLAERFEVKPVTQGQVLKALETLKTEKAAGRYIS